MAECILGGVGGAKVLTGTFTVPQGGSIDLNLGGIPKVFLTTQATQSFEILLINKNVGDSTTYYTGGYGYRTYTVLSNGVRIAATENQSGAATVTYTAIM